MKKIFFVTQLFLLTIFTNLHAQWDGNPARVSNPVTTSLNSDATPFAVTDGAGGVIVAWVARDGGGNAGVYTQRKTANGGIAWGTAEEPVLLFSYTSTQDHEVDVEHVQADGSGGAYLCWNEWLSDTSSNVYVQHINHDGSALFRPGGTRINEEDGHFYSHSRLCADSSGVFITWSEQIAMGNTDVPGYAQVFVQRYNAAGVPQWAANTQVSTVDGLRALPEIVSDGTGGVFIAFADTRNSNIDSTGAGDNIDLYAQHINNNGNRLWGNNDMPVANAAFNQNFSFYEGRTPNYIISDNAGGFIVSYMDYRNDNDGYGNLYAQRISSNGTPLWSTNGAALHTANDFYKNLTQVVSDGANGMVASWDSYDNNFSRSMYMQRVTGAGNRSWGNSGITVSSNQYSGTGDGFVENSMIADGAGFYIACWPEYGDDSRTIAKAQKFNGAGLPQWSDSTVFCANLQSAPAHPVLTSSFNNTVIAVWEDSRNLQGLDNNKDLYAAKINSDGSLVNSEAFYSTIADGNWNNPAIWFNNIVPPAGADIVIMNAVVINVDITCNTLAVIAPGTVTVNTGVNVTILH